METLLSTTREKRIAMAQRFLQLTRLYQQVE
jgi:hypothetical protein